MIKEFMNPSDNNGVELTHPWKHLEKKSQVRGLISIGGTP